eukprot:4704072-Amphidinium_carterae.1
MDGTSQQAKQMPSGIDKWLAQVQNAKKGIDRTTIVLVVSKGLHTTDPSYSPEAAPASKP